MHKYYDPRMFDVLGEAAMRSCFDRTFDIAELPVELKTAEDFFIAGFRVKVDRADEDEEANSVAEHLVCGKRIRGSTGHAS